MDCELAQVIYSLSFAIERYERMLASGESQPNVEIDRDRGVICFNQDMITAEGMTLSSDPMCVDVPALRNKYRVSIGRVKAYKAWTKYAGGANLAAGAANAIVDGTLPVANAVKAGYRSIEMALRPNMFDAEMLLHNGVDLGVFVAGVSSGVGAPLAFGYGAYVLIRDLILKKNPQCTLTEPTF